MKQLEVQVSGVRWSRDRKLIEQFECKGLDANNSIRQWYEDRTTVLAKIRSGKKYFVITLDPHTGLWKTGVAIKVVKVEGEEFIKTVADVNKRDVVDPLPLF